MVMRYFTVYRTVNLFNGKFYFGVHKTENPNDEYLGSGTYIKRAVEKHGAQSFRKEVLFIYLDAESAFAKEDELVQCWRHHPLCKNLRKGGSGGFDWINSEGLNNSSQNYRKATNAWLSKSATDEEFRKQHSKRIEKAQASPFRLIGVVAENKRRTGRKHRPETIEKMQQTGKTRVGSLNGRFGTRWVHNLLTQETRCIKAEEFEGFKEAGWNPGRLKLGT